MDNQSTEKKGGDQTEVINELSIRTHLRNCKMYMEKSANLHVEFWSQLKEDSPDLGKLSELGYKISIVNALAEE